MNRLQELAGIQINELQINNPSKLFSWVSSDELCYDKEDLINNNINPDKPKELISKPNIQPTYSTKKASN